jgi:hypothetical protein
LSSQVPFTCEHVCRVGIGRLADDRDLIELAELEQVVLSVDGATDGVSDDDERDQSAASGSHIPDTPTKTAACSGMAAEPSNEKTGTLDRRRRSTSAGSVEISLEIDVGDGAEQGSTHRRHRLSVRKYEPDHLRVNRLHEVESNEVRCPDK